MIKFFGGKICEKKNSKKSFQLESPKDFERNERKKKYLDLKNLQRKFLKDKMSKGNCKSIGNFFQYPLLVLSFLDFLLL